jgi:hypothetical protein
MIESEIARRSLTACAATGFDAKTIPERRSAPANAAGNELLFLTT